MNLIFLGPPGAGKGTMAELAAKKYNIPHISTGDIFREEMKKETELGKLAASYINKGDLVPDEVTIDILKKRIEQDDCKNGFILDGFPRTIPQADALKNSGIKIDKVINFVLSNEKVLERLGGRRTCKKCGAIFHIKTNKPMVEGICDKCDGELYVRDDQTPEAIKERLEVYKSQTEPLIEYYNKEELIADINAEPEILIMFKGVEEVLDKL